MSVIKFSDITAKNLDSAKIFSPSVDIAYFNKTKAMVVNMTATDGERFNLGKNHHNPSPYAIRVEKDLIKNNPEIASFIGSVGTVNSMQDDMFEVKFNPVELARIDGDGLSSYELATGFTADDYIEPDDDVYTVSDMVQAVNFNDKIKNGAVTDVKQSDVDFTFLSAYADAAVGDNSLAGFSRNEIFVRAYNNGVLDNMRSILNDEIAHQTGYPYFMDDSIHLDLSVPSNTRLIVQGHNDPNFAYELCSYIARQSASYDVSLSEDELKFFVHCQDVLDELKPYAVKSDEYDVYAKEDDFDNLVSKYGKFISFMAERKMLDNAFDKSYAKVIIAGQSTFILAHNDKGVKFYSANQSEGFDVGVYGAVDNKHDIEIADDNIGAITEGKLLRLKLNDGRKMITKPITSVKDASVVQTNDAVYAFVNGDKSLDVYCAEYPDGIGVKAFGGIYDKAAVDIQSDVNTDDNLYLRIYTSDGNRLTSNSQICDKIAPDVIGNISYMPSKDIVVLKSENGPAMEIIKHVGNINKMYFTDNDNIVHKMKDTLQVGSSDDTYFMNGHFNEGDKRLCYETLDGKIHNISFDVHSVHNIADSVSKEMFDSMLLDNTSATVGEDFYTVSDIDLSNIAPSSDDAFADIETGITDEQAMQTDMDKVPVVSKAAREVLQRGLNTLDVLPSVNSSNDFGNYGVSNFTGIKNIDTPYFGDTKVDEKAERITSAENVVSRDDQLKEFKTKGKSDDKPTALNFGIDVPEFKQANRDERVRKAEDIAPATESDYMLESQLSGDFM